MIDSDLPSPDQGVLERVRDMYTRYPYPPIGSEIGVALFALLDYVRYVLWPGRPTLEGLRVLDAGCGTGHTAVQIARDYPMVEVIGIDISPASLEVAQRRARAAGVSANSNLTFRQASIEDLAPEEHKFDYIVSSGVLHHMADPVEGARRLGALLSPTGGLGIMVYAPHGRHGVYVLQEALRRMVGNQDLADQVVVARQLLAGLPEAHPFNPKKFQDQDWDGDAGLVDLLLHVQDRSFTVPQLFDLLDQSGLRLERFLSPLAYRPENHTSDPSLRKRLGAMGERDGPALAELLCGVMSAHSFLATRAAHRPLRLTPTTATLPLMRPRRSPLFRFDPPRANGDQSDGKNKPSGKSARQGQGAPARTFTLSERNIGPLVRTFELEPWIMKVCNRCDGALTAKAIVELPEVLATIPGATTEAKQLRFNQVMSLLAQQEVLLFEL